MSSGVLRCGAGEALRVKHPQRAGSCTGKQAGACKEQEGRRQAPGQAREDSLHDDHGDHHRPDDDKHPASLRRAHPLPAVVQHLELTLGEPQQAPSRGC